MEETDESKIGEQEKKNIANWETKDSVDDKRGSMMKTNNDVGKNGEDGK